jgi:hypothetical protein
LRLGDRFESIADQAEDLARHSQTTLEKVGNASAPISRHEAVERGDAEPSRAVYENEVVVARDGFNCGSQPAVGIRLQGEVLVDRSQREIGRRDIKASIRCPDDSRKRGLLTRTS